MYFLKDLFIVLCAWVFAYMCACAPSAWGQKVLDSLELELQAIVSYHVGFENQAWVLGPLQEILTTEWSFQHPLLIF